MSEIEHTLAVFIDFENLALGFKGKKKNLFNVETILARLVEKGKVIAKKAYADWSAYSQYKQQLHAAAIEMIEIPKRGMTGKNSADIRLCVDAMDMSYSKEHIDSFVIVSGDSDFSPLVSKLKENGKHVIGIGMHESTSPLLSNNCDEFIFYEDLLQASETTPPRLADDMSINKKEAFALLFDSITALMRENKDILWSSMIKQTMQRKKPSFNESSLGYRSFSEMLKDAEKRGYLLLTKDSKSGTLIVEGFAK
ncbi:MAG: NYN domain-containing protein [Deltaproteobacteria bacterium]|nr:NYN domain-containing protein [Candidatus Tharpellaceae bacterium]